MVATDFAAELTPRNPGAHGHWILDGAQWKWVADDTVSTPLYVKSVDDVARTITLKFKGAPSGEYLVYLSSKALGRLDVGEFTQTGITTRARVTAISP